MDPAMQQFFPESDAAPGEPDQHCGQPVGPSQQPPPPPHQ
jgi:hypothetical protein